MQIRVLLLETRNDKYGNFVLIECQAELKPYLLHLIKFSLNSDLFLATVKHATVVSLVNDANGDTEDFKNCRPGRNTPFLGKLVEKVALEQLNAHQEVNKLFDHAQSGFRKLHSYETVMSKVVNEGPQVIQHGTLS